MKLQNINKMDIRIMKTHIIIFLIMYSANTLCQQHADNIKLVEKLTNLDRPWGAEFLPDGRLVISEMAGTLKLFDRNFKLIGQLDKPTDLDQRQTARFDNAGAFDVVVDPKFSDSHFIYWSYAARFQDSSYLKVVRLKIRNDSFSLPEEVFSAKPATSDRFHYGGALLFDSENNLLIATGERYSTAKSQGKFPVAQEDSDSRGKIWLITDPASKLQSKETNEARIIAKGLRNVQSMENVNNTIWLSDHGAVKGDELNILTLDGNYGWPLTTGGEYKDKDYQPPQIKSNVVRPVYEWKDFTMAPSGLMFYRGNLWSDWQGQLFVSGLSSGRLQLLKLQDGKVVEENELIIGIRQRDVLQSPGGRIFILSDETKGRMIEIIVNNEIKVTS
jgi:aldose sugar dehydrogenase